MGRLLAFLGLAFIASIAYMDPSNFATNIRGGGKGKSRFPPPSGWPGHSRFRFVS